MVKSDRTIINSINNRLNSGLLNNKLSTTITYAAATTGKFATGAFTLATVTGIVALSIFGVCTTNLVSAGGGTLEVGTAASTAGAIAQTTGTDLDAGDIWHDASPDKTIALSSVILQNIVTDDIIYTIGTADISAGVITYYILWAPISADGNVVIA